MPKNILQELIDYVAFDMVKHNYPRAPDDRIKSIANGLTWQKLAKIAIISVQENERCSECNCKLEPPALCSECSCLKKNS